MSGSLIFGIGTQSNNGLGSAQVFKLDGNGCLVTSYKNSSLNQSFIDSGSNALYFPDSTIQICDQQSDRPGILLPGHHAQSVSTIIGISSASSMINFSVADAGSLFNTNAAIAAAVNLAGSSLNVSTGTRRPFDGNSTFDWGLPFYFGRNVATAIETRNTSGGMGPYFAF